MLKGSRVMQSGYPKGGNEGMTKSEVVAKGNRQSDGFGCWKLADSAASAARSKVEGEQDPKDGWSSG